MCATLPVCSQLLMWETFYCHLRYIAVFAFVCHSEPSIMLLLLLLDDAAPAACDACKGSTLDHASALHRSWYICMRRKF